MFTKKEAGRIFSKISIDPVTQCWNWTGGLSDGYGRIYWRGKRWKAHRLFYFWKYGTLPKWINKSSKEIDHICNNRRCVNPGHLRLISNKINVIRGKGITAKNARKTHCIHGHNAFYVVGNRRRCRECRKIFDASEHRKQWRKKRNVT